MAVHHLASPLFDGATHMKMVVESHDFSLAVGGEVLRSSYFDGCSAVVSREGKAAFFDEQNDFLGQADQGDGTYPQARLQWSPDALTVQFDHLETVDYYPNCDGEYDRWARNG